jgi:hypothetical protein
MGAAWIKKGVLAGGSSSVADAVVVSSRVLFVCKIARVTGLLRNGDIDLNDAITNVRHIHDAV